MLKKHVLGSFNSEIFRLSFEDIFWGTLDTYTKKLTHPWQFWGGGGGCTLRSAGSYPIGVHTYAHSCCITQSINMTLLLINQAFYCINIY